MQKNINRISFIVTLIPMLSNVCLAAPSESERFSRLNGGLQVMRTMHEENRVMGGATFLGVGAGLIAAPLIDTSLSPTLVWYGAAFAVGGVLMFLLPTPLDRIQKEVDGATNTATKMEVLERHLRNAAETTRTFRKITGWTLMILSPVVIGLSVSSYGRSIPGYTGAGLVIGGAGLAVGITSLLRQSPMESIWEDYQSWSGGSSRVQNAVSFEPTLSLGTPSLPGLGAGLAVRF